MNCPQCNGPSFFLGRLDRRSAFRCRNCGWTFHEEVETHGDGCSPEVESDPFDAGPDEAYRDDNGESS